MQQNTKNKGGTEQNIQNITWEYTPISHMNGFYLYAITRHDIVL